MAEAFVPPAPAPGRVAVFLESIKFSHSVFALPFALMAMVVAANGIPGWWTLFCIVGACVAARTAAMCFNRLADREFDARNPRTARRALVTGELSRGFMVQAMGVSAVLFFLFAGLLNRTCLLLAPPTLAVLLFYSMAKRFTSFSHYVLGLALALAPLGAWMAVAETVAWTPLWLACGVLAWVAGFDILYSCQDVDVDRREAQLHSLPKRLGVAGAMRVARASHAVAAGFFLLFWFAAGLGGTALFGVLGVAVLLAYQHSLVRPTDLSRLDAAFFTTNGFISVGFFAAVLIDVLR